jgi:hypothetical protein
VLPPTVGPLQAIFDTIFGNGNFRIGYLRSSTEQFVGFSTENVGLEAKNRRIECIERCLGEEKGTVSMEQRHSYRHL